MVLLGYFMCFLLICLVLIYCLYVKAIASLPSTWEKVVHLATAGDAFVDVQFPNSVFGEWGLH